MRYVIVSNSRDFPSTAVFIARQCGIVRNQNVDDIKDLTPVMTSPVKQYDPEDTKRICKTIALTGKDIPEMNDTQWEQVSLFFLC
jgi:magnesium-transporting ATPase (P-type)